MQGPWASPLPPGVTGVLSVKWVFFFFFPLCPYHGFAGGMGEAGQRNSSWTLRSNARVVTGSDEALSEETLAFIIK